MTKSPDAIFPETAEEFAAALRQAHGQHQAVEIRGAGTKAEWGRPGARADLVLGTSRLNRILTHQPGDLTATVEAGATLRDVNDALAPHGQWLPLDPPFAERATIGGILATNDSGPLRHRYGTPRDLVIGIQLATADGVLARAGGQVVKNVAGYDLAKLISGSFGSLAASVSATFKLMPLPRASKTMVVSGLDADALGQSVRQVMSSQLEALAFELCVDTGSTPSRHSASLLLRFASLPEVVDAQIDRARALLGGSIHVHDGDDERALWRDHAQRLWNSPGAIVRASWLPADVAGALADLLGSTAAPIEIIGRAGIGAGLIRIHADAATEARTIEHLRESTTFGNVVLARGSAELKGLVDIWAPQGDRQPIFDALKRTLDPHGILNPGRGPI